MCERAGPAPTGLVPPAQAGEGDQRQQGAQRAAAPSAATATIAAGGGLGGIVERDPVLVVVFREITARIFQDGQHRLPIAR